ncbi:hypothetical protein LCGC14_0620590 [marine sediment metagenome]|uniref:Uncharacterized protein n=1 Tax=marine sediment metagenome TaxID=412755 RepID=A0A0F9TRA9_9ZZZZ
MGRDELRYRWEHWNELCIRACKSGQKQEAKEARYMRDQFQRGDQMNIGQIKTRDNVEDYLHEFACTDLGRKDRIVLANVVYKWCLAKAKKPETQLYLQVGSLGEPLAHLRTLAFQGYIKLFYKVGVAYYEQPHLRHCRDDQFRQDTYYLTLNSNKLQELIIGLTTNLVMEVAMQAYHLAQFESKVADEAEKVGVELVETAILSSWDEYSFHLTRGRATVVVGNLGVTLHIEPCILKVHNLIAELLDLELKRIKEDTKYILRIDWPYLISRAKTLAGGA